MPRIGVIRSFNKNVTLYLLSWALLGFAYFGINAVLFNLYLLRLGFDTAFIGLLIGLGQLFWAAAAFPAGMIGKRIGLARAFALGFAIMALAYIAILQVEFLPSAVQKPWLISMTLVMWFGAALATVNGVPLMMGITTEENRKHAFAYQSAVIALFGFLGSLAAGALPGFLQKLSAGALGETRSIQYTLALIPLIYLVAVFFSLKIRVAGQVEREKNQAARSGIPLGLLIFIFGITILQNLGDGGARAFLNIYLDKGLAMGTGEIGLLMGVVQVIPVAFAIIAPMFIGWLGTVGTLTLTSFGVTAGSFLLAYFNTPLGAALGLSLGGMLGAVLAPARSLFSQEVVAADWRSATSALGTIGTALGWGLVAIMGGSLLPAIGFSGLFSACMTMNLLSALMMVFYQLRHSAQKAVILPEAKLNDELEISK